MRFPLFSRRKEQPNGLSIEQALASERPDLAVAEWLQVRGWGEKPMPEEVNAAHFSDFFLSSVNMGGALSLVETGDWLDEVVHGLRLVGLRDFAVSLDEARAEEGAKRAEIADGLTEQVKAESASIERAIHDYIRRNLETFKSVD